MCNFASLFRILLAVLVILPFADAIPQTSPAPAQASPSTDPTRNAFVLAATVGGFRVGLLVVIAVSAGTFACILALPAHSRHAHEVGASK